MGAAKEIDRSSWSGLISVAAGYQFALSGDGFQTSPTAFSVAPGTTFANPLRPLQNSGVSLNAGISLISATGISLDVGYSGLLGEIGQNSHDVNLELSIAF